MCGTSNSSVVPRIKYVNNSDPELLVTNISTPSKNRITISILLLMFSLYGLVIACIQEAHTSSSPWSIDLLKMNDGDLWTGTASQSWGWGMMQKPFWSHKYHWFHPCTVPEMIPQTCQMRNPQHETHLLNSFVGSKMRRIVGQMINITNTQQAIADNMLYSRAWHSTVGS